MFTEVLSINAISFLFGKLGNEEARLPSENEEEKEKRKRKPLDQTRLRIAYTRDCDDPYWWFLSQFWVLSICKLVIVMILIDGFLVNFESSQFANQNWNCPPSPYCTCSTVAFPWELMEFYTHSKALQPIFKMKKINRVEMKNEISWQEVGENRPNMKKKEEIIH